MAKQLNLIYEGYPDFWQGSSKPCLCLNVYPDQTWGEVPDLLDALSQNYMDDRYQVTDQSIAALKAKIEEDSIEEDSVVDPGNCPDNWEEMTAEEKDTCIEDLEWNYQVIFEIEDTTGEE